MALIWENVVPPIFSRLFFIEMPIRVSCECGNEIEVSAEKTDAKIRCTRCGRRVDVDDSRLHQFLDDDQPSPSSPPPIAPQPHSSESSTILVVSREPDSNSDPEATVLQTAPSTGGNIQGLSESANDFELKQPSSKGSGGKGSSLTPASSPSSSSGTLHGSKYDLTQRVMHPISKPVIPAAPFIGPNEYEIHHILRVHQKGGMGRILVAYDKYLKREVAIKELHQEVADDEGIVRRFIGEAETTAQLEHPGVVPIHRLGEGKDGLPYYTMKMIKGETLQDAIKAYHRKPKDKQELMSLVRRLVSISKTMAFAHSKGVIHRDLKPANMMLGEHGETLVMDWGLAKSYGQAADDPYISIIHRTKQPRPELTMVGSIVGTPAFMSPEQANAEDKVVGPLSDVFSLGTVLYYLLAGQTAFAGRSTQEVLSKVRICKPTPPSQIKAGVPFGLEAICLKAMEKLPENRYQGAAEFADDLCRWLDNEPILAVKDTFSSRIRRWSTYCREWTLGIIAVFLLSLIFAGIGVWIMAQNQNDIASDNNSFRFAENIRVEGTPSLNIWHDFRGTGKITLVCKVAPSETEMHHVVSIYSPYDLSIYDVLTFSLLEIHSERADSLKNFSIRFVEGKSYYEFAPIEQLWESRNREGWHHFSISLHERAVDWSLKVVGEPSSNLSQIDNIEIRFDTASDTVLSVNDFEFR